MMALVAIFWIFRIEDETADLCELGQAAFDSVARPVYGCIAVSLPFAAGTARNHIQGSHPVLHFSGSQVWVIAVSGDDRLPVEISQQRRDRAQSCACPAIVRNPAVKPKSYSKRILAADAPSEMPGA